MRQQQKYSLGINNKGVTLLASVVMTVFLGLMIGVAFRGMNMEMQEGASREVSQESFNNAEAGLEYAIFMLRQDETWSPAAPLSVQVLIDPLAPVVPANIQGTYTVSVAPALPFNGWPSVWVTSQGVDRDGKNPRTILAQVIVQSPAKFLVSSLGDITIRSGANYGGDFLARDIDFQVDTSLALGSSQRNINIIGKVSYMRNLLSNVNLMNPALGVSITGGTQSSPGVTFTGIDKTYYKLLAQTQGSYHGASKTISGSLDCTTLGAVNGVVFVEGDLHISGTFAESLTFIATGDIYIDDDLQRDATVIPAPQVGLLAVNNVIIPSTAPATLDLEAFVLADGGIFTADKTVAKGTLNFTGAIAVRGRVGGSAIDLNAFATRNYNYNAAFVNNTIPFLSSMANVVGWSEI